jgi:hypothetical protein
MRIYRHICLTCNTAFGSNLRAPAIIFTLCGGLGAVVQACSAMIFARPHLDRWVLHFVAFSLQSACLLTLLSLGTKHALAVNNLVTSDGCCAPCGRATGMCEA